MSAARRTARDKRRRKLGQNFLEPAAAERLIAQAEFRPGELVLDIGAGRGAFSFALAARGARVLAVERDPHWARALRTKAKNEPSIQVLERDFLSVRLPREPFRVAGSVPFGRTTEIFRRLFDDPESALFRADLLVQWEVGVKRAARPPGTLLSTLWAPWWEIRLAARVPAKAFRPIPKVDGAWLSVTRRDPPFLPLHMAPAYAGFIRENWPF